MAKRTARRGRRNEEVGYPGLDRTAKGLRSIADTMAKGILPGLQGMMDSMSEFFQPIIDALPPGLTIEDLADYEEHNGGLDYRLHSKCSCVPCMTTRQLMKDKMPFSQPNSNGKSNVDAG